MEKRREFSRVLVEVCRNCRAEGYVHHAVDGKLYGMERCPVCGGSGLIRKKITGTIIVEPYQKTVKP